MTFTIRFASHEDLGLRSCQEDAFVADPALGIFAVADGMGAMLSGRPAADLALKALCHNLQQPSPEGIAERLHQAVYAANDAVFARTEAARIAWKERDKRTPDQYDPHLASMHGAATTIVALLISHNEAAIAHVGDSRAYRFRSGKLEQLTVDHRLVDDARRAGMPESELEKIPVGILMEALGIRATARIELRDLQLEPGDVFLLCSDGLTDMVDHHEIERILMQHVDDMDTAARALVARAADSTQYPPNNEARGLSVGDNVSVVLVQIAGS